jgi:hypothetical protein
MQVPTVKSIEIDSPDRIRVIRGAPTLDDGVRQLGNSNLQLLIPELLPQEIRRIKITVEDQRLDWKANMWSERYGESNNIVILRVRMVPEQ